MAKDIDSGATKTAAVEESHGQAARRFTRDLREIMEVALQEQEVLVQRFAAQILDQRHPALKGEEEAFKEDFARRGEAIELSTHSPWPAAPAQEQEVRVQCIAAQILDQRPPPSEEEEEDGKEAIARGGEAIEPLTSLAVRNRSAEVTVDRLRKQLTFQRSAERLKQGLHKPQVDPLQLIVERRKSSPNFLARWFWKAHYFFKGIKEPAREGWLANIVLSSKFEFMAMLMIVLNGALVVYQADSSARLAGQGPLLLERREAELHWDTVADYLFVAYYLVELSLRLFVHRFHFFRGHDWGWNILDFATIVMTVVDLILTFLRVSADILDANFLRVLRVFKVAKSLRIIRVLHFISDLRKLLECMIASFWQIVWSCVLIAFITLIFGTILCQSVTTFLSDMDHLDEADITSQMRMDFQALASDFGDVSHSMLSLFKANSGGADWGPYHRRLSITGFVAPFAFVLYIFFFHIAAWNVISSLFVERALAEAQPDMDKVLLDKRQQELADAMDLLELMQEMDKDGNGLISVEEFMDCMCCPRIQAFLEMRCIDIKDAEMFFNMLQAVVGNDEVQLTMLVNALMRMRGVAMNLDVQAIQFQQQVHLATIETSLGDLRNRLGDLAEDLRLISRGTIGLASL